MKITTIPQIYRNVNRLREILAVLSKYGLADGISRLNLDFAKGLLKNRDGAALARHTREERIRMALEDLGPTFIKLGQILSTRPDLIGAKLARELQKLQDDVPADPPEVVREIVEQELGQPIETLFADFCDQPIASASIGQVHRARLHSGEPVVVKVQHAGIHQVVHKDLDVLAGLAHLATRLEELEPYRPVETVAEFQRMLRRELDFGREERNLHYFYTRFQTKPWVVIPKPFTELSTSRVLTMEYIEGIKLASINKVAPPGLDREKVARRGADMFMDMVFGDGFFHADPHPGNVLVLPGNRIGLLDFGMVARIDERLREDIEDMLLAIVQGDALLLTQMIMRVGAVPEGLNEGALQNEVADFVTHYGTQPVEQLKLAQALEEMTDIIFRFRILLPAQVAMLLKVFITLEGSAQLLSPNFSLVEVVERYHRKALLRRLSPSRRLRKIRRIYSDLEHLVEELPRRILALIEQVQTGKFDVHLDHRGLEPSVNRLVVGIMSSALFLGSALMLSQKVPPLLFRNRTLWGLEDLSVLGVSGCVAALLMGLRLLRAINKSGHLDSRRGR